MAQLRHCGVVFMADFSNLAGALPSSFFPINYSNLRLVPNIRLFRDCPRIWRVPLGHTSLALS